MAAPGTAGDRPGPNPRKRSAVILDRDGTIVVYTPYLSGPSQVELLPSAGPALGRLAAADMWLVVATNQSAVGRGYISPSGLDDIHARLAELLAGSGVTLDGIYACPHVPTDRCACRKPEPGLAQRAADELGFDLADCFVVGDSVADIELGERIGATTVLVRTGNGESVEREGVVTPDFVVDDLSGAADVVLSIAATSDASRERSR